MTVKLTFECADADEAKAILDKLAGVEAASTELVENTAPPQPAEPEAPAKKKAAKKKAASKTAKVGTAAPAEEEQEAPEYTIQDIRDTLAALVEKESISKAKEVLSAYKAKSAGDLKPEKYADFVQACNAFL